MAIPNRALMERHMSSVSKTRSPFRSADGWALGLLIEAGAVRECPDHGHMKDRSDIHAWYEALEHAREDPFPGLSADQATELVKQIWRSVSDTCPEC